MPLTDEQVAKAAIRHAGKFFPHLLTVSSRFGPRAKDIAVEYIKSSPAILKDPNRNTLDFVEKLMFLIRSEFGKKGVEAKRRKKLRREREALRVKQKEKDVADRKRQTSLSFT